MRLRPEMRNGDEAVLRGMRLAIGLVAFAAWAEPEAKAPARGSVVLIADLREADEACPCGEIIRAVRAAKARGVAVREVPPSDSAVAKQYGVTVAPTVLVLDSAGKVVERHEGESTDTVAAIKASLERLAAKT